jgi:hypothetical protein
MLLYLSDRSPLNSVYANPEGQVLFKTVSPMRLATRTTTISFVLPNDIGRRPEDMHDRFAHLAEVEHNMFTPSIIRIRGEEKRTNEYFRKEGWGPLGR